MDVALSRRRRLRREATDAETALWFHLRDRRLGGFKFRRQHSCGPFILDFFCADQALAVELDGGQHFDAEALAYDERRTRYLAAQGIRVVRFGNDQVFSDRAGVIAAIALALGIPSP